MINRILETHIKTIKAGFKTVDHDQLDKAIKAIMHAIYEGSTIWVCGNGASAAIAEHWACDFTKGCYVGETKLGPRVISLSANIPLMTAIANDISYDEVYSYQLERLSKPNDILIVVSSSGNSPNIIRALEIAKENYMMTISLTGFDGGEAKELAQIPIHCAVDEYEATEDIHQALMQVIAKNIRERLGGIA